MLGALGYADFVRYTILLALWSVCPAFGAEIYQWVAPDGTITFSNQPHPGAKKLDVPPLPTYKPPPLPKPSRPLESASPSPQQEGHAYEHLQVLIPAPDATVWSDQDTLPVKLKMDPPLKATAGDKVVVTLDGKVLDATFRANSFQIAPVYRGTHSLQVKIEDNHGNTLIQSSPVTFHMRHHSLIAPQPGNRSPAPSQGFRSAPGTTPPVAG